MFACPGLQQHTEMKHLSIYILQGWPTLTKANQAVQFILTKPLHVDNVQKRLLKYNILCAIINILYMLIG